MTGHATLHGMITDTGGENADERGFDWGYSSGSYPYDWTEIDSYGTGVFEHQITGLTLGETVYFRAKAHNSAGWGYGSEKSFVVPSAVTYKFRLMVVRLFMRPRAWAKLKTGGVVVGLRRPYVPWGDQPKAKVESVT